jgi:hypothetical protein
VWHLQVNQKRKRYVPSYLGMFFSHCDGMTDSLYYTVCTFTFASLGGEICTTIVPRKSTKE